MAMFLRHFDDEAITVAPSCDVDAPLRLYSFLLFPRNAYARNTQPRDQPSHEVPAPVLAGLLSAKPGLVSFWYPGRRLAGRLPGGEGGGLWDPGSVHSMYTSSSDRYSVRILHAHCLRYKQ